MLHTRNNDAEEKERSGEYAQRNPTTCARCDREGELGRAVYKSRSRLTTLRFLLLGRVVPVRKVGRETGQRQEVAESARGLLGSTSRVPRALCRRSSLCGSLGTLSDVVLCEDFAGLVRVTDVLECLCCVAADLTEEDFVATGVLVEELGDGVDFAVDEHEDALLGLCL